MRSELRLPTREAAGAGRVEDRELSDQGDLDHGLSDPEPVKPPTVESDVTSCQPPVRILSPITMPPPPPMSLPPKELPSLFVPQATQFPQTRVYGPHFGERLLSASEAYNIIHRWNISSSGARGSDVETFLMRIEEGRELVPIADEDLFKRLPFYLTGITLQWYRTKRSRWVTWRF